jgi:NitT/TauT family transport system substrate-binding protein
MRPDPAGSPMLNRRRILQKRLLLPATCGLVALLAVGTAGCSTGGGGAGTAVSGVITIAATPGIDDAPLWIAQQKGLFSSEGLNVQIKDFGSESANLAAVANGQAKIAATDFGNVFALQQQHPNLDLRILADGYNAGAGTVEILTLPKYNISTPLGLRTVKIGLPDDSLISALQPGVPPSLNAAAAAEVISNYLASGADTLNWDPLSQQQEISDLADGQLHAVLLTQPYVYEAESTLGATELVDAFSGETAAMPLSGYVATSPWVKANSAAVADFQAALTQAQTDASMVNTIQQALPKLPSAGLGVPTISTQVADMVSLGTYPTSTTAQSLQRVADLMGNDGMLSQSTALPIPPMLVKPGS